MTNKRSESLLMDRRVITLGLLLLGQGVLWVDAARADITGKIAGRVLDRETREALVGVNVVVAGTALGATTDLKGEYYILQVPPGTYAVRASLIGYQTTVKEEAQVLADLTTRIDFVLGPEVIGMGEVTTIAERPMVKKDITSSTHSVSREELRSIPNVKTVQDAIQLQPGVVGSNFRGGRSRETLYMVDGVPIANPVRGGYSGLNIPPSAVAELTVITGGFNAEYGQAQSGIVNVVTKGGAAEFSGGLQWKTDGLTPDGWKSHYGSLNLSGPEPVTRFLLPALGLAVPGDADFFLSTDIDQSDTYAPYGKTRVPVKYLFFDLAGRLNNRHSANAKLTYRATPNHRLALAFRDSWSRSDPYNHIWKNLPDNTLTQHDYDRQLVLSWTHTLSPSAFYAVNLSQLAHYHTANVGGRVPSQYPTQFQPVGDTNRDGFADSGMELSWVKDQMQSVSAKADLTWQIHPRHLVKGGAELSFYNLSETSISYPGWHFPGRDTIPGEWNEYGAIRTAYDVYPNMGAVYLQDKMEFDGLIVNLGLRYDYWMPGRQISDPVYVQNWENKTGLRSSIEKFRGNLSPRLGISYPITDRTVMYFAYGRFTQLPSLLHVYRDAYVGSYAGNPYYLNSEVTSAYEIGFNHEVTEDVLVELKGFIKDVSGLTGLTTVGYFGLPVLTYVNKDYGTTRGFELQLKKRYGSYTSGQLNYTLSWASGRSSSPDQEAWFIGVFKQPPRLRDYRLDWDQRHTLNFTATLRAQEGMHLNLLGLELPDLWGIELLWRIGSGLPYTPPYRGDLALQSLYNTETGPFRSTVDLRVDKGFTLSSFRFTLFAEILNVFNRRNPVTVNSVTGEPYKFGDDTGFPDYKVYSWKEIQQYLDPTRVGPGRQVFLGFTVDW
jgi:outer membrane receptor protein involved in Fe transport